jgi:VanZ family protein
MPKYLLTLVVSALILIAVLLPGSRVPQVDFFFGFDKVIHFTMFATWAVALRHDLKPEYFRFTLVILSGLFFSLMTEVLQILVEGRSFDLNDFLADGLGLIAGFGISKKFWGLVKKGK